MVKIQKRWIDDGGAVNPTDQVLLAKHLLEATLMGNNSWFLELFLVLCFFFVLLKFSALWG
jgi:hypothetical protein